MTTDASLSLQPTPYTLSCTILLPHYSEYGRSKVLKSWMGYLFSKPLTRADLDSLLDEKLKSALTPITEKIKSLDETVKTLDANVKTLDANVKTLDANVKTLDANVKTLLDIIVVPEGDARSQQIAIAIRFSGEDRTIGHGAIVSMKLTTASVRQFYLLSAAHVLVDVVQQPTIDVVRNGTTYKCQHSGELFIHSGYVLHGWNDCGFLRLEPDQGLEPQLKLRDLLSGANTIESPSWTGAVIGQSVVAHGLVFLRGAVTSAQNGRFSVLAHSVPGQSGTLVLDKNGSVTGIVHRSSKSSKHRGKHAAGAHEDAAVVYCDSIIFNDLVCINNSQHHKLLFMAEDIPEDVASGAITIPVAEYMIEYPDKSRGIDLLVNELKVEINEHLSLERIMGALWNAIRQESYATFVDPQLVAWYSE